MKKKQRMAAVRPDRGFTFAAKASKYIWPTVFTMLIIGLVAGIVIVNVMADMAKMPLNLSLAGDEGEIFKLTVDPIFIGIGAGAGVILGIIFGIIRLAGHNSRAAKSHAKHRKTRVNVQRDTAPIICESHANAGKKLGRGRLYFTGKTVEFYSNKFSKKPHKNIYIPFEDIRSISYKGSNKLFISSKSVTYQFKLPRGAAKYWAAELIQY